MSKKKSKNEFENDPDDRLPANQYEEMLLQVDDSLREIDQAVVAWTLLDDADRLRGERDLKAWIGFKTGWPAHQVGDEIRRVMRRVKLQQAAGTTADREAARQEWGEAKRIAKSEGGKLRDEIARLQNQLDGIERDADRAAAVCEAHENACKALKECLPSHVRRFADRRRRQINDRLIGPLRSAEDRVAVIKKALNVVTEWHAMDYMERSSSRSYILRLDPEAVIEEVIYPEGNPRAGGTVYYHLSADISNRRQQWESELADAKVEAERLRVEYDAEIAKVDSISNWPLWANDELGVPA